MLAQSVQNYILFIVLACLLLVSQAHGFTRESGSGRVGSSSYSGLVNTNVIRTIDLKSLPTVYEQVGVVVQNEHDSKVFKSYTVVVPYFKQIHLAHIGVRERKGGVELDVTQLEKPSGNDTALSAPVLYRATLKRALQPGEKISLNIDTVYLNTVLPRPAMVKQSDDQKWEWAEDLLVSSVYPTRKQKTVVNTRGVITSFAKVTEGGGSSKNGRSVTFGPFTSDMMAKLEGVQANVRFRDNSEQLEALTHRREYFVSHWGNDLNILEYYALRNRAPAIEDGFDKVKQTMSKFTKSRDNFVKTLLLKVPADARQMYVVDEIGNVSTSAVTGRRRIKGELPFKVMQLKPRYPLAGGWNYTWWHGYSVPLSSYLRIDSRNGNQHLLRVPFIGALTGSASQEEEISLSAIDSHNTASSNYELRITLPEGASNVNVHLPFAVDSMRMEPLSYYFDSTGRTVVVIEQRNVAPDSNKEYVLVTYSYSALSLWKKPLVIAGVIFTLFVMASAISRTQLGLLPLKNGNASSKIMKKSTKTE
ncbi:Ribophorin I [Coemansia reversa NRRL 1564]|uniref:Dolichyl-diphosphooligosaccharide--protein glycosyltransferase subunit 1 n=1 Tax=Coemansia reversa (strain ATCC 12441 / NRRL 1564) TaxID=763665 RepID=A0A2G5BL97_COERN|nr:Ribophorin I [Coemansia reversa NRRL 1564]|eukprot:PIA19789.1 Ribophorin I [Coemansia reversa NRRL 1564]